MVVMGRVYLGVYPEITYIALNYLCACFTFFFLLNKFVQVTIDGALKAPLLHI